MLRQLNGAVALDACSTPMLGIRLDGTLGYVNQAAADLLGYDRSDLLGEQVHGLVAAP